MKRFKTFLQEEKMQSFDDYIRENTITYTGELYHATYLRNLYDILSDGLFGNTHGEIKEDNTVSTSFNENIFRYFSDSHSGLEFDVTGLKVFVIPDWLVNFYTDSGLEFDVSEEESRSMIEKYNIPMGRFDTIKENFLSSVLKKHGIYAACLSYVAKEIHTKNLSPKDESEIIIFDPEKLMQHLKYIYVDGNPVPSIKEALEYFEDYDLDDYEYKDE